MTFPFLAIQTGTVRTSKERFISLDAIDGANCSQAGVHILKSSHKNGFQNWRETALPCLIALVRALKLFSP